jgi:hypothetical protein
LIEDFIEVRSESRSRSLMLEQIKEGQSGLAIIYLNASNHLNCIVPSAKNLFTPTSKLQRILLKTIFYPSKNRKKFF